MKSAQLTYHSQFPVTPISSWVGARQLAWVRERTASGQLKRPRSVQHPFLMQRALWCQLTVEFDGLSLRFAMPQEVDHFIKVMSRNPLPSGRSLVTGQAVGRPRNHWLSRLPKKAKPWKMRQSLCDYLNICPEVREMREFYREQPLRFSFPGFYDSYMAAYGAEAVPEAPTQH